MSAGLAPLKIAWMSFAAPARDTTSAAATPPEIPAASLDHLVALLPIAATSYRQVAALGRESRPRIEPFHDFSASSGCPVPAPALPKAHEIPRRSQGLCPLRRR